MKGTEGGDRVKRRNEKRGEGKKMGVRGTGRLKYKYITVEVLSRKPGNGPWRNFFNFLMDPPCVPPRCQTAYYNTMVLSASKAEPQVVPAARDFSRGRLELPCQSKDVFPNVQ